MLTVDFDRLELDGKTVLDLGCGNGRHSFAFAAAGAKVVAADLGRDEVVNTRNWLAGMYDAGELKPDAVALPMQANAYTLPFADASFDYILTSEILEHLPEDTVAMRELRRVIKPGGELIVTVPSYGPELVCWALSEDYHNVPGGHVRIYRRSQLLGRLRDAGFQQKGSTYKAHALHSPYWWLKCAVGPTRDVAPVRAYHKLLVWDLMKNPLPTRVAEKVLQPVLGKSFIVHLSPC